MKRCDGCPLDSGITPSGIFAVHKAKKEKIVYQGSDLSKLASRECIYNRCKYILSEMHHAKGEMLVIGFGDGSFEILLRKINPSIRITSIDINDEFYERVISVSNTVIIDDYITHNFNKKYDYIISGDVIEHIFDTDSFLTKTHELLLPSGYFFLQTPNLASWHSRLSLLFGYMPEALEVSAVKGYFGKWGIFRHDRSIHHVRVFTYRALCEMVKYYQFEIVHTVGIDCRFPRLFKQFPNLSGSVCLKCMRRSENAKVETHSHRRLYLPDVSLANEETH